MQPLFVRILLVFALLTVCHLNGQESATYTKDDGLLSFPVTATYVDSRGIVWIGSGAGLNAYSGDKWYAVDKIDNNTTGVQDELGEVIRIHEDRRQNIWFITSKGVFLYDGTYWVNYIRNKEEDDYLADRIFEDRRGWIWISQEYRKEFQEISALGYTLLGGSMKMFNGIDWYRFDDEIAGTLASKFDLSPTFITDVLQDRQGNMWFATLQGLKMFDGEHWHDYHEGVTAIPKVLDIMEDKKGYLWAGDESGISRFKGDEWVTFNKKDGLSGNVVYKLQEDQQGRIWAYSRSDLKHTGLCKFENGQWVYYDPHDMKIKGEIIRIIDLEDGLMACSEDGVSLFDGITWKRHGHKEGLDGHHYYLLQQDKDKTVWTATETGLFRYIEEGKWSAVYRPDSKWKITCLFFDDQEGIWIGTDKSGLYFLKGEKHYHYSGTQILADEEVNQIFGDKKHNTWVVTRKGITTFSRPDSP